MTGIYLAAPETILQCQQMFKREQAELLNTVGLS